MLHRLYWGMTVFFALIFVSAALRAQTTSDMSAPGRVLIVYDSSNSMWGELSDKSRKYEAGRNALSTFLNTEFGARQIGFRAYGHRRKTDCRDSELVTPFSDAATAKASIEKAVTSILPTGKTPITYSLREGRKDFDSRAGDILLISDGIETCDIDPCTLMQEWQNSNVNIRVLVVGVGLTEIERSAMACIADVSGGKYFDADSADGFTEALNAASEAIDEPAGEPNPVDQGRGYALRIAAADDQGRSFIVIGQLLKASVGRVERFAKPAIQRSPHAPMAGIGLRPPPALRVIDPGYTLVDWRGLRGGR